MSNAYVRIGVVIVAIIAAAAAVVPATNMQIALGQGQQTPFDALAMRVNLTPDPCIYSRTIKDNSNIHFR